MSTPEETMAAPHKAPNTNPVHQIELHIFKHLLSRELEVNRQPTTAQLGVLGDRRHPKTGNDQLRQAGRQKQRSLGSRKDAV